MNTKRRQENFLDITQLNPEYDKGLNNKGIVLYILKRYEEALNSFNIALELNPEYDKALYYKGLVSQSLGRG